MFSLIFIGFLLLILGLIFFPKILYGKPFENASLMINEDKVSEPPKDKIEKFSFDSDYIDKIRLLLENWKVEKKYLDIDSSTFSLSKEINIPIHHVTYFFNNSNDEKYIDWRNRLRIEHSVRLIKNKEGFHKTIESLGKESGFRANSAFLRCFKQFTGKLPNDIIKEYKS
jgi:AraC-like DNA-binding protein